jgi:N-acetyltransferase 10
VVNLHYMLAKATVRTRPNVLWCYHKDLGFTTHAKKRMKKIQVRRARDLLREHRAAATDLTRRRAA